MKKIITINKEELQEKSFIFPEIKHKSKTKKGLFLKVLKYLLYAILYVITVYGFVLIHEFGHALATIWSGVRVNFIDVNIFYGQVNSAWNLDNYSAKGIVTIMGWITTLSIAIPLSVYSYIKRKEMLFTIVWSQIIRELIYWGISPFMEFGDAYNLIKWAEYFKFNYIIDVVYFSAVSSIIIVIMLYALSFYIYNKIID